MEDLENRITAILFAMAVTAWVGIASVLLFNDMLSRIYLMSGATLCMAVFFPVNFYLRSKVTKKPRKIPVKRTLKKKKRK